LLRFEVFNTEYDEDLTLQVVSWVDPDEKTTLYSKKIKGKKQFNSWFYFGLDKDVCLLKGADCSIRVTICPNGEAAAYQFFPQTQIQETFKVAKCPIATRLDVKNYFASTRNTSSKNKSTVCIFTRLHFLEIQG